MSKSVMVVGATGYVGRKVIDHLLARDVEVHALVREKSNASYLEQKGVVIHRGDLTNKESLIEPLRRAEIVISTATGFSSNKKKGDSLKGVDDKGNRNLVEVLKEIGVKRFVFTAVLKSEIAQSVPHFWAKKSIENYIEELGIPTVVLKPGAFLDQSPKQDFYADGLVKGSLKVLGKTTHKWTNILSDDLANYLATAALDDSIPLGSYELGMEEPMNAEMLVKFSNEYSGKSIKLSGLPWPVMGPMLSFFSLFKPDYGDVKRMFDFFFEGNYIADTTRQIKFFGKAPTVRDSVYRYCEKIGLPRKKDLD